MQNVEECPDKLDMKLSSKKRCTPLSISYCLELDMSSGFFSDEVAYYQYVISIICWIVELGQIDIPDSHWERKLVHAELLLSGYFS